MSHLRDEIREKKKVSDTLPELESARLIIAARHGHERNLASGITSAAAAAERLSAFLSLFFSFSPRFSLSVQIAPKPTAERARASVSRAR
jgi:hypothetical protein